MKFKFDFDDIVRIDSKKPELAGINNKYGVICGMSTNDEETELYDYAVDILDENNQVIEGWCVEEEDLQPTGKKANPKDFMTGESIRVRVDPETGQGEIVDKDAEN